MATVVTLSDVIAGARSVSQGKMADRERAEAEFAKRVVDMERAHEAALAGLGARIEAIAEGSKTQVAALTAEIEVLRIENERLALKLSASEDQVREVKIAVVKQAEVVEEHAAAAIRREAELRAQAVSDARRAERNRPFQHFGGSIHPPVLPGSHLEMGLIGAILRP